MLVFLIRPMGSLIEDISAWSSMFSGLGLILSRKYGKTKQTPGPPENEDRVQIVAKDEFPSFDMKMSLSPKGDLQFGVFIKKGQKLKCVGKESTHTPGTLRAIPSGVLNRLVKIASIKLYIQAAAVDSIYPDHANALRKAGLAPSVFPTMGELWGK